MQLSATNSIHLQNSVKKTKKNYKQMPAGSHASSVANTRVYSHLCCTTYYSSDLILLQQCNTTHQYIWADPKGRNQMHFFTKSKREVRQNCKLYTVSTNRCTPIRNLNQFVQNKS